MRTFSCDYLRSVEQFVNREVYVGRSYERAKKKRALPQNDFARMADLEFQSPTEKTAERLPFEQDPFNNKGGLRATRARVFHALKRTENARKTRADTPFNNKGG